MCTLEPNTQPLKREWTHSWTSSLTPLHHTSQAVEIHINTNWATNDGYNRLTFTVNCSAKSVTNKATDWLTRDTSHSVKLSGKLCNKKGTMAL